MSDASDRIDDGEINSKTPANDDLNGAGEVDETLVGEPVDTEDMEDEAELKKQIEALEAELEGVKKESERFLGNWQYAQADLENYKRRVEKDRKIFETTVRANSMRKYLEIMDDIALALKARPSTPEAAQWVEGLDLIFRKMQSVLEMEGVSVIPVDGEFDPTIHEAITSEPNPDVESGHIIDVVQQGYMMDNRVLRPARVRVAL
ncbi:MAG: nucleotide exchange factor GrpE [Anaerolineaceae bacterium]|nr:nucleotide exchange factor GrpE [Anaerolineaceae bacterium]